MDKHLEDKKLEEQNIDRREALKKLGKCAAYAAPVLLSVMVAPKKAVAGSPL